MSKKRAMRDELNKSCSETDSSSEVENSQESVNQHTLDPPSRKRCKKYSSSDDEIQILEVKAGKVDRCVEIVWVERPFKFWQPVEIVDVTAEMTKAGTDYCSGHDCRIVEVVAGTSLQSSRENEQKNGLQVLPKIIDGGFSM